MLQLLLDTSEGLLMLEASCYKGKRERSSFGKIYLPHRESCVVSCNREQQSALLSHHSSSSPCRSYSLPCRSSSKHRSSNCRRKLLLILTEHLFELPGLTRNFLPVVSRSEGSTNKCRLRKGDKEIPSQTLHSQLLGNSMMERP